MSPVACRVCQLNLRSASAWRSAPCQPHDRTIASAITAKKCGRYCFTLYRPPTVEICWLASFSCHGRCHCCRHCHCRFRCCRRHGFRCWSCLLPGPLAPLLPLPFPLLPFPELPFPLPLLPLPLVAAPVTVATVEVTLDPLVEPPPALPLLVLPLLPCCRCLRRYPHWCWRHNWCRCRMNWSSRTNPRPCPCWRRSAFRHSPMTCRARGRG